MLLTEASMKRDKRSEILSLIEPWWSLANSISKLTSTAVELVRA